MQHYSRQKKVNVTKDCVKNLICVGNGSLIQALVCQEQVDICEFKASMNSLILRGLKPN